MNYYYLLLFHFVNQYHHLKDIQFIIAKGENAMGVTLLFEHPCYHPLPQTVNNDSASQFQNEHFETGAQS